MNTTAEAPGPKAADETKRIQDTLGGLFGKIRRATPEEERDLSRHRHAPTPERCHVEDSIALVSVRRVRFDAHEQGAVEIRATLTDDYADRAFSGLVQAFAQIGTLVPAAVEIAQAALKTDPRKPADREPFPQPPVATKKAAKKGGARR